MIQSLLVDGHVHFHPCFEAETFLDAARSNFAAAAQREKLPPGTLGCLLFAECAWHDYFRKFVNGMLAQTTQHWTTQATSEACSVIACYDGRPALILIGGRQIVTAEGLEVLALGCYRNFPDGMPITAVIESVLACGAIAVLPWGLGKWWGKRGRILTRMVQTQPTYRLFLGDNGGRPGLLPQPRLLRTIQGGGVTVLAGTDPLPLPWQTDKVGRYGFTLHGEIDPQTPAASIKRLLYDSSVQPHTYGKLEGLCRFVRATLAMRAAKGRNALVTANVR